MSDKNIRLKDGDNYLFPITKSKNILGGLQYLTDAPTENNTDGIKLVHLTSEPAIKYEGYLYIITEE